MIINSVSLWQNTYTAKVSGKNSTTNAPVLNLNNKDSVSFSGGQNPQVLRNQLKILLSQDIWAVKLKVKMPESALEKEVLLELLQNRLKLDRFTRLSNEKAALKSKISQIATLEQTNPQHPDLPQLRKELAKYGNIDSVFKTIDKNIELEIKKNQKAYDYFKSFEPIENEYWDKKLVKPPMAEKFFHKINKNNINADGQYSTKELIDIISSGKLPTTEAAKAISKPVSKKQLLLQIEQRYEQLLRESVDVYEGRMNHNDDARNARKMITEIFKEELKKFPEIQNSLNKMYTTAEAKFTHKIDRLSETDIYPIGEIWVQMKPIETKIKTLMQEINELKIQLAEKPKNTKLQSEIAKKEKSLERNKSEWLKGLRHSIRYENINRERMITAGRVSEYDYLTAENKTLKRHKAAFEIYKNNDESIPTAKWAEIL